MRKLLTGILCLVVIGATAQKSPFPKFGKITAEHLKVPVYSIDSSAGAVVLSDEGYSRIRGNSKGWFSIETIRHKVVHILKKNSYDAATVQTYLYAEGEGEERMTQLKAVTYNLENGKVVESKLEKSGIFKEKLNKRSILHKFTMPNVREGSIIEFEYTVESDFIHHVDPWVFQSNYPTIWSEFTFSVPQFFSYNSLGRGYHPVFLSERNDHTENFSVRDSRGTGPSEIYNFSSGVTDYRWAMKDIPALKEEKYTSTLRNFLSRIEFQLASFGPPLNYKNFLESWGAITRNLLESESFGTWMKGRHLDNQSLIPVSNSGASLETAVKIYEAIRDNYTCTGLTFIYANQSPKEVITTKKGTLPEINLLLLGALREVGFQADAVLVSTKGNGYIYETSPMTGGFNYVIVRVIINNKEYFLDGTEPGLGFGYLPLHCYNGHARVVNSEATPVYLRADNVSETSLTQIILLENEKGVLAGTFRQKPGYYSSADIRDEVKKKGKDEYLKGLTKEYGEGYVISNLVVDSLHKKDGHVEIKYAVELTNNGEDILYINPMFKEGYQKNPFAAATRNYPVEMPYASDETIILSLSIPKGYALDELPKQALVKLDDEGKSFFEYRIQHSDGLISFRSRIKIDRALFLPDEYDTLREFFNFIVTKQNEQIVLKKIK